MFDVETVESVELRHGFHAPVILAFRPKLDSTVFLCLRYTSIFFLLLLLGMAVFSSNIKKMHSVQSCRELVID